MFKISKNTPKFTVIINNYNYALYLNEAILSVLEQKFANFELIIVDDGSSDNSREVIKSFSDDRLRSAFKKNGGQASALNAGFALAKGEYVAFLDSDDLFDADKLERLNYIFSKKTYSLVQHQLRIIDKNSMETGQLFPTTLNAGEQDILKLYREKVKTDYFYPTSGLCAPSCILKKIFPLNELQWKICADGPLARTLPFYGLIYTIIEPLGSYRIHGNNNWMNTDIRKQTLPEVQQRLNDYIANYTC